MKHILAAAVAVLAAALAQAAHAIGTPVQTSIER